MNVTINARHCEIPQPIWDATERRVTRLGRYNQKLADVTVTYEVERASHAVEIRLGVAGEPPVVARGSGADFRAARARHRARIAPAAPRAPAPHRRTAASPRLTQRDHA